MSASVVSRGADLDPADVELVVAVRGGDDRAFETLYLRYQGRITAYVRGMVHDHGRAEDITQDVFMSALRRMRGTDAAIVFKPWIYEIAKNACIDAWRRSRNTNEVSFDAHDALGADDHGRLADPRLTPDSVVDNKDAIDNLCGAFGGLSPTHHEILVMREFEGLSYREIGERLGMSRPGVESTLFRARRRLSEEYEELVSGERCLRVQRIVDSHGGRAPGLRDQRRMARHLAHCQPCRRYARFAGVDLDTAARPAAAAAAAAKIAAWFPLPLFLRRRWGSEQLVGQAHHGQVAQWSASIAGSVDPGTVSGWSKAVATATTVAVASLGAGAAIHEHRAIEHIVGASAPASTAYHAAPHSAGSATATATAGLGAVAGVGAAARPAQGSHAVSGAVAVSPAPAAAVVPRRGGVPASATDPGVPVEGRRHSIAAGDAPGGAGATSPLALKPDPAVRGGMTGPLTKLTQGPGAAPDTATAGQAAERPLGHVLEELGTHAGSGAAGGAGAAGSTPATGAADAPVAAVAAPAQPLADAVKEAGSSLGAYTVPAAPAAPAAPAEAAAPTAPTAPAEAAAVTAPVPSEPAPAPPSPPATATALVDSVSAAVTATLASTVGRSAP
jgi:RNA polymerase sigma factor (sigma-70 family)